MTPHFVTYDFDPLLSGAKEAGLLAVGIDLYNVKELMGHSDIAMTQRYSYLSPEGLQEIINVLEK